MAGNFLDTNILVYLASSDQTKADRAEALVRQGGTISVRVLDELSNVARRKLRMSWSEIDILLSSLRTLLTVEPITIDIHENGLALAERYTLSIYDSMIVASALHAKCDTIWSEDIKHGMIVDTQITIRNPFLPVIRAA